jgi:hypothetical protein
LWGEKNSGREIKKRYMEGLFFKKKKFWEKIKKGPQFFLKKNLFLTPSPEGEIRGKKLKMI